VQKSGSATMHGGGAPMTPITARNERSTYIGESLLIKGEVSGSEPIHIEGRVEAQILLPGGHVNIGRDEW
jgi:cytoskeletal protein CcmA (bactofilin family)